MQFCNFREYESHFLHIFSQFSMVTAALPRNLTTSLMRASM